MRILPLISSDNNVEIKEELIDVDPLCVQEITNSEDGDNKTVVDDVDIVKNKIEIDYYDHSSF